MTDQASSPNQASRVRATNVWLVIWVLGIKIRRLRLPQELGSMMMLPSLTQASSKSPQSLRKRSKWKLLKAIRLLPNESKSSGFYTKFQTIAAKYRVETHTLDPRHGSQKVGLRPVAPPNQTATQHHLERFRYYYYCGFARCPRICRIAGG